ncbi:MAG: hypothetical protein DRI80_11260 [Chloroflexota bacterium]|nr:MAG: hypothetical protein DRI80_11260 [Chloroflexota bacterium]
MANKQTEAPPQVESARGVEEIERIRDIIFGAQMRDYERRFQITQRDLDRLQQEIDRLAERLVAQEREQSKKLQDLRQEMRKAHDGLRDELRQTAQKLTDDKVDRQALGEMLIQIGTYLETGAPPTGLLPLSDILKDLGETEQD